MMALFDHPAVADMRCFPGDSLTEGGPPGSSTRLAQSEGVASLCLSATQPGYREYWRTQQSSLLFLTRISTPLDGSAYRADASPTGADQTPGEQGPREDENAEAIALIESWIAADWEEDTGEMEDLKRNLDSNRPADRKLFP